MKIFTLQLPKLPWLKRKKEKNFETGPIDLEFTMTAKTTLDFQTSPIHLPSASCKGINQTVAPGLAKNFKLF